MTYHTGIVRRATLAVALAATSLFATGADKDKEDNSAMTGLVGQEVSQRAGVAAQESANNSKTHKTEVVKSGNEYVTAQNDLDFSKGEQKIAQNDLKEKTKAATKAKEGVTNAQNEKAHFDNEANRSKSKSNDFKKQGDAKMTESKDLRNQATELKKQGKATEASKLESKANSLEAEAKSSYKQSETYAKQADEFTTKSKAQDKVIAERQQVLDNANAQKKMSQENLKQKNQNVEANTKRVSETKEKLSKTLKDPSVPKSVKQQLLDSLNNVMNVVSVGDAAKKLNDAYEKGDIDAIERETANVLATIADVYANGAVSGTKNIIETASEAKETSRTTAYHDNTSMAMEQYQSIVIDLHRNGKSLEEAKRIAEGFMSGNSKYTQEVKDFYKQNGIDFPERKTAGLTTDEILDHINDWGNRSFEGLLDAPSTIWQQTKNTGEVIGRTAGNFSVWVTDTSLQEKKEDLKAGVDLVKTEVGNIARAIDNWWNGNADLETKKSHIIDILKQAGASDFEARQIAEQYINAKIEGKSSNVVKKFQNELENRSDSERYGNIMDNYRLEKDAVLKEIQELQSRIPLNDKDLERYNFLLSRYKHLDEMEKEYATKKEIAEDEEARKAKEKEEAEKKAKEEEEKKAKEEAEKAKEEAEKKAKEEAEKEKGEKGEGDEDGDADIDADGETDAESDTDTEADTDTIDATPP